MVDATVHSDELSCVLTTIQRVTARRHVAELRFAPADGGIYVASGSGGLATWCLNLQASEQAVVRVGEREWLARAVIVAEDDPRHAQALEQFASRYGGPNGSRDSETVVAHLVFVRALS